MKTTKYIDTQTHTQLWSEEHFKDLDSSMEINNLKKLCIETRADILRYISNAESGHPGSALSIVEILNTLYFTQMQIYPKNPKDNDRDRFILSKGHGDMALYSVLANKGFFINFELESYRKLGSRFQGHPEMGLQGIDATSGSLGQGLSIGCGMALRAKIDSLDYFTYVLMGDGELNEGQIWEAAMFATAQKLDNLVGIVDYNGLQHDGACKDILPMDNLTDKWNSFGWKSYSCDGHDLRELYDTFKEIKLDTSEQPRILIAKTIKGKGVIEYENNPNSHSVHGKIDESIMKRYEGDN